MNLTSAEPMLMKQGQELTFTYAVNWLQTSTPFSQRFERYLDYNFFEHKVSAVPGMSHCCGLLSLVLGATCGN